ncbi:hypothetical protein [Nocardia sp. NPDC004722]
MSRGPRYFFTIVAVLSALGTLLALRAATASGEPEAVIKGRGTVTAHVTGEKPGNQCQIAGKKVAGPWGTADSGGTVILTLEPGGTPVNQLRVICQDPSRGDVSVHTVRSHWITYDGILSPIRRAAGSKWFKQADSGRLGAVGVCTASAARSAAYPELS